MVRPVEIVITLKNAVLCLVISQKILIVTGSLDVLRMPLGHPPKRRMG
jgi:hypothetical protein